MATARDIKNADYGKNNKPGDFPMTPWHCLVCSCCRHRKTSSSSLPALIAEGLELLYNPDSNGENNENTSELEFTFELTKEFPKWVKSLLKTDVNESTDQTESDLPSLMDEANLKGIAVIQQTEISERQM